MQYTLMHKGIPVLDIDLDNATSSVQKIGSVYHIDHLLLGTTSMQGKVDRAALNAWWIDRCIPASRSGIRKALEILELPNTQILLTRCSGLSLSDQYWVKPRFTMGKHQLLYRPFLRRHWKCSPRKGDRQRRLRLPLAGQHFRWLLKKRWKSIGGKRCLLKTGSNPFMQQPFNEVIANIVAQRLGIPHVPYSLLWMTTHI